MQVSMEELGQTETGKITFSIVPIYLREGSISFIVISGALVHVLQEAKE